ncbi:hypothetical protein O9992_02405 [Vibrio lentus]|nr:hypothetical protein [Vibrio lentus]
MSVCLFFNKKYSFIRNFFSRIIMAGVNWLLLNLRCCDDFSLLTKCGFEPTEEDDPETAAVFAQSDS